MCVYVCVFVCVRSVMFLYYCKGWSRVWPCPVLHKRERERQREREWMLWFGCVNRIHTSLKEMQRKHLEKKKKKEIHVHNRKWNLHCTKNSRSETKPFWFPYAPSVVSLVLGIFCKLYLKNMFIFFQVYPNTILMYPNVHWKSFYSL